MQDALAHLCNFPIAIHNIEEGQSIAVSLDLQRELLLLVPFHRQGGSIALQRDGEIPKRTGAEGTYAWGSGSEVRRIITAISTAISIAIITTRSITRPTTTSPLSPDPSRKSATRTTTWQRSSPHAPPRPAPRKRKPIPMQLEQRQPGRIAELATAAVTELPPRHGEEQGFILVRDLIAHGRSRVALWPDDKASLGFSDIFAAEGQGAFGGF